jgi:SAM-dependent methyltransferase
MTEVLRGLGEVAYRVGALARPSDVPDHGLREFVAARSPGRALDLGCGAGRNALYLAAQGWDTTGVEMLTAAVETARRSGSTARFHQGDVTRLTEMDLGGAFDLLMDGGCYHMIGRERRDAYAESVTAVAAPGATLIMVGFTRFLTFGMHRDELVARFTGWRLVAAEPVTGEQMHQYVSGPKLMRGALRRGRFNPWRYRFERLSSKA